MDAVIIVSRSQMPYGDVMGFISRSEHGEYEPWEKLYWRNAAPMPPIKEKPQLRISAPIVQREKRGWAVLEHSRALHTCTRYNVIVRIAFKPKEHYGLPPALLHEMEKLLYLLSCSKYHNDFCFRRSSYAKCGTSCRVSLRTMIKRRLSSSVEM